MPELGEMDIYSQMVRIPSVGTFVEISGVPGMNGHKGFVILRTRTDQEENPVPFQTAVFTTILTILAVDDKGEDAGKEPVEVNEDMYDIVYI